VTQQQTAMSAEAQLRQVTGTPSFFIQVGKEAPYQVNGQPFSIETFSAIFEDALSQP
jgi:protein-disulfide isomerase